MAYCTQSDLEGRYGADRLASLADYDGDGSADADTVSSAIDDAQAEIDSYLQTRYSVPVDPVPKVLRVQTAKLAMYYLALQRDSVTEDLESAQKGVISWCKQVAAGQVTLAAETTPTESESANRVELNGKDRVFGRDKFL